MKLNLLYGILLAAPFAVNAGQLPFSYNYGGADPRAWGNSKAETIDVAVRLHWPSLVGKQIVSLSVPVTGSTDAITDVSGFITSELKTRNKGGAKINDPDICSVAGTLEGDMLTVRFAEPYTIPAEGVYVGYSLTLPETETTHSPVATAPGSGAEGAFWYHASKSQQRWRDEGADSGLASAMTLTLAGEFEDNAATPCMPGLQYTASDSPSTIDVIVISLGTEPLKTIDYTYVAGDITRSGSYTFADAPSFGRGARLPLEIEALGEPALSSIQVTIDKVNGQPNNPEEASGSSPVEVLPFIPHNRPLVEEYTGLRCGYCPMGWVILKQMAEDFGRNEFVALSFHSGWFENGAMVYLQTSEFPYTPDGYPAAQVNRDGSVSVKNIHKEWQNRRSQLTEGEISVSLSRDEANPDILHATSTSRFIHDNDQANYQVTFALVADGLSNPDWRQFNAYINTTEKPTDLESEYWDLFLGKEQNIKGLVYDDIVIHMPDAKGIEGSLPSVIEAGREYDNEFTVDTSALVNVAGEHTVTDFGKSRVVAIIVDSKTGNVVNCASSDYADGTKILSNKTVGESEIVETIYHDLCGRRLAAPGHGVCIETVVKADGTRVSRKVLRSGASL